VKRVPAAIVAACLLVPAPAAGHRVDEYLQAARLSLTRDRLMLEMELTPGTMLAPDLLGVIDTDRSGAISPEEAANYGRIVLGEVTLALGARTAPLTLTSVDVPSIDELRDGSGAIRIRASSDHPDAPSGRVRLHFRNDHRPGASVYLVNALLPQDPGVRVLGQTRDGTQREAWIDYEIAPRAAARLTWPVIGLGVLAVWLAFRRRAALSGMWQATRQA
jgi:hypothetical protein